jgi:hypothetical protein
MEDAPRDGTEILLFYKDFCGEKNMVVSGHWECEEGREFEATWSHSWGHGDADKWMPLPQNPDHVDGR